MIRQSRPEEINALITLWLASTTQAHPFISPDYWLESESIVRQVYLPQARTWVYVEQERIVGFISILDERFIGALFVTEPFFGRGIGSALIGHAQQHFPELSLEVYQENRRAVDFYQRRGFQIAEPAWQEETQHATWIMSWKNGT